MEELCGVVDEMMDKFMDEVIPAASLIAGELVSKIDLLIQITEKKNVNDPNDHSYFKIFITWR